jgi:hypothetical protein
MVYICKPSGLSLCPEKYMKVHGCTAGQIKATDRPHHSVSEKERIWDKKSPTLKIQ